MKIQSRCKMLIFLVFPLLLAGCWDGRELDTLAIVTGVGVDRAASNMTTLTLLINKTSDANDSAGPEGTSESYITAENTSNSLIQSFREFTHSASRRLFLQHNQVIVFGREQAESGIWDLMDFFIRDHETRMDVWVFIADGTAHELLSVKSQIEKRPSEHLVRLLFNQDVTAEAYGVDLLQLVQSMRSPSQAAVTAFASIIQEDGKPTASLSGLAVLKKGRFLGTLNEKETMGFRWIINDVPSGLLPIFTEFGEGFLEIKNSKTKLSVDVVNGVPIAKVRIQAEASLAELRRFSTMPLMELEGLLASEGASLIEDCVASAMIKAQEYNADIFGFGNWLYQRQYGTWQEIAPIWDTLFPQMQLVVEAEVKLNTLGKSVRLAEKGWVTLRA